MERRTSLQYISTSNNDNLRFCDPNEFGYHEKAPVSNVQHRSCEIINSASPYSSGLRSNYVPLQTSSRKTTSTTSSNFVNKSTFYSMWNTVKYEFNHRFRNKFNFDTPICFLGQLYHSKMCDSINWNDEQSSNLYAYENFKKDYVSRIWLTYRKDYPPLLDTDITSDSGWGCMIRSGQMIIAQAFLNHFHGRCWRWEGQEDLIHRMIIKWFADCPDKSISPFSIHEIVRIGRMYGKNPGDWLGPASISVIFRHLIEEACKENNLLNICCYVAHDCTVYLPDIMDLCMGENPRKPEWHSIIILVPVRLGGESFNMFYAPYLKQILSVPMCLGIIGGKPRHSLYFLGFQDDKLLAMDPHYCQKSIDVRTTTNFPLESFHCRSPRRVSLQSIDPSCTIGFYLKNQEDLEEFKTMADSLLKQSFKNGGYPIFSLENRRYESFCKDSLQSIASNDGGDSRQIQQQQDRILQMQYRLVDSEGNVKKIIRTEDFVML